MIECWVILNLVGFILVFFRKDSKIILNELYLFLVRPFPLWIISLLIGLVLLPITIPFSLVNIFSKDEFDN